jgi:hypothetical protein
MPFDCTEHWSAGPLRWADLHGVRDELRSPDAAVLIATLKDSLRRAHSPPPNGEISEVREVVPPPVAAPLRISSTTSGRRRGTQAATLRRARLVVRAYYDACEAQPDLTPTQYVEQLELKRTKGRRLTRETLYRYLRLVAMYGME